MRNKILIIFLLMSFSVLTLIQCKPNQNAAQAKKSRTAQKDSLQQKQKKSDKGDENEIDIVPVEVTTVTRGDISNYILLNSNLETEIMADVYSRIQGIVDSIAKEEGQYVSKGELMLKLEAKEYVLAERKAKIEYDKQEKNFQRLKSMFDKNLLSEDEFEKARFARDAAKIQWEEAELNLSYTEICSPIAGRVGDRLAKIGQRIQPTDKLFSVVNNAQVIAVVYVPEKNLGEIKIGQKAIIYSDNLKGEVFDGWIKRISPVVDPSSGTFKVTVGVRNRGNKLRPGMFVNIRIIVDTRKNVVLIPKTAIVYENEYMNVYVVRDEIAHKIYLSPGYSDNEKVESLKDVQDGDKIIVVGQAGMKDKTKVRIVKERENPLAVRQ